MKRGRVRGTGKQRTGCSTPVPHYVVMINIHIYDLCVNSFWPNKQVKDIAHHSCARGGKGGDYNPCVLLNQVLTASVFSLSYPHTRLEIFGEQKDFTPRPQFFFGSSCIFTQHHPYQQRQPKGVNNYRPIRVQKWCHFAFHLTAKIRRITQYSTCIRERGLTRPLRNYVRGDEEWWTMKSTAIYIANNLEKSSNNFSSKANTEPITLKRTWRRVLVTEKTQTADGLLQQH